MPVAKVKPHQHGTSTGYRYGCRCYECYSWRRRTRYQPKKYDYVKAEKVFEFCCREMTKAELSRASGISSAQLYRYAARSGGLMHIANADKLLSSVGLGYLLSTGDFEFYDMKGNPE